MMKHILPPEEMPKLAEVGFKVYSEYEEDGLLLYIFSLIGSTNRRVVELCAGDGRECMAANLLINHGWEGVLIDGLQKLVERGQSYFAEQRSTWRHPPIFKQAWLTRENVNDVIAEAGFVGPIDLLSVDVDGIDYYLLEAISIVEPRVIICETHNVIPSALSLTVPYDPDFRRMKGPDPDFMGASLLAVKRLLGGKGYRLIGGHRFGFNAIFMRNELGQRYFPEVSVESVHNNAYTRLRSTVDWERVKNLPWVEV
jgi:hypothetical protein